MTPEQLNQVLDRLIAREGGYVNDPRDPGGETKYGISKRSYPELDIKNLTKEDAKSIYTRDFYLLNKLHQIENVKVAEVLLDWFVHSGASVVRAKERVKALQNLLGIPADGYVGPATIEAINKVGEGLVRTILYDRMFFLARLTKHPYIVGWLRRLVELGL
jgi:lysozyme family protein